MKSVLTDRAIRALKAPEGRVEVGDASCRGLSIRCTPAGVKTWTFAYKFEGKMRRITLGEYPTMGLSKARQTADERRKQRNEGTDPRAERDRERAAQAQQDMTFGNLCDRYVEHAKARGKVSWKTDEGYLNRPKAKFGKRAVSSITKRELIDFLETIASTSKSSANRTQSTVRTMWGWAAERDYIPMNFLAGIKKVGGKEAEKDRVLSLDQIKAFFAALDDSEEKTQDAIRRALKLILLTAQRPGEVAGMMRSELCDLDGPRPHWIIPAARTKNKKAEHTVPLSPSAVRLIVETLKARDDAARGANDQAIFESRFEGVTSLARHSLSQAVRRIVKESGLVAFTPHDLRRTGATLAQAARLPIDFVKALLNHNDKGVTGVYARWHMFEEKREAVLAIEAAVNGSR
ncbi:tyrosine-type recombinase/integrase [Tardiphaga sp. vice304]|uniref:tyrosine-type recombinase/integrase n=1 Tax=Tardiphaga sp. vice304 TaxID=2592817 RepID=UPI00143D090F|nr:site-specific integrase [Tardiphaga sp. vice304]